MFLLYSNWKKIKCCKCGSKEIYTRMTGHPDTKGTEEAICGNCGHKVTLRRWDFTDNKSWHTSLKGEREIQKGTTMVKLMTCPFWRTRPASSECVYREGILCKNGEYRINRLKDDAWCRQQVDKGQVPKRVEVDRKRLRAYILSKMNSVYRITYQDEDQAINGIIAHLAGH